MVFGILFHWHALQGFGAVLIVVTVAIDIWWKWTLGKTPKPGDSET